MVPPWHSDSELETRYQLHSSPPHPGNKLDRINSESEGYKQLVRDARKAADVMAATGEMVDATGATAFTRTDTGVVEAIGATGATAFTSREATGATGATAFTSREATGATGATAFTGTDIDRVTTVCRWRESVRA